MMPVSNIGTRVPLQIRRGVDISSLLTFTAAGAPLDLTGCELAAQISFNGQPIATFTIAVNTPPTLGTALMSLSATESLAIPPFDGCEGDFWWGLSLTDANGKISSPLYGPVQIYPALVSP
jgi:hypothetical protein